MENIKQHWDNIYLTKQDAEVSWFQQYPLTSLRLIKKYSPSKEATIIDVGAGNSRLTKLLMIKGYSNLTVLDISTSAIDRSKKAVGNTSNNLNWIASDILEFKSERTYDVWHDRAVFHFLTNKEDIMKYVRTVSDKLRKDGIFILATFSIDGPKKCSGLEVSQYDKNALLELFAPNFSLVRSFGKVHQTPMGTNQEFIYAVFKKL